MEFWNSSFLTDPAVFPQFLAHSHLRFAAPTKITIKISLVIARAGKTTPRMCSMHGIPQNSIYSRKQQKSIIFTPEQTHLQERYLDFVALMTHPSARSREIIKSTSIPGAQRPFQASKEIHRIQIIPKGLKTTRSHNLQRFLWKNWNMLKLGVPLPHFKAFFQGWTALLGQKFL